MHEVTLLLLNRTLSLLMKWVLLYADLVIALNVVNKISHIARKNCRASTTLDGAWPVPVLLSNDARTLSLRKQTVPATLILVLKLSRCRTCKSSLKVMLTDALLIAAKMVINSSSLLSHGFNMELEHL